MYGNGSYFYDNYRFNSGPDTYDDYGFAPLAWVLADKQRQLALRVTRYVKRAPLGMMLTSGDGFRMVK